MIRKLPSWSPKRAFISMLVSDGDPFGSEPGMHTLHSGWNVCSLTCLPDLNIHTSPRRGRGRGSGRRRRGPAARGHDREPSQEPGALRPVPQGLLGRRGHQGAGRAGELRAGGDRGRPRGPPPCRAGHRWPAIGRWAGGCLGVPSPGAALERSTSPPRSSLRSRFLSEGPLRARRCSWLAVFIHSLSLSLA